ncbi:MAG TPA: DUF4835 family protein [Cyclobacteriaceae bacterium]|nr:DUF4835 family protein [Cyclobacteriaceae bacterium]
MRKLIFILLMLPLLAEAQELNCKVIVNADQVQTSDRAVFRDMETAFAQFLNTRKWTNDTYKAHERINCNILITINRMPSIGNFTATVQVQSGRPVFNTNYETVVFNFADRDWEFDYIESQPLEFNDNVYISNLTSMLAFYAYVILGFDYDSFSELGGNPHFQKALQIVNNAQQVNRPGWQPLGSNRNRYWLIENITNAQMVEIRKSIYQYHRHGLDLFEKNPDQTREVIVKCLREIKKVRDINPNAILVISFFDAKGPELANIFSDGNLNLRREAYEIIVTIDPSKRSNYQKMIGG